MHGILPGDYYNRPQGEKDLIWALSSYSRFLASLLQCAGVADYSTFTVNGAKTALQIASGAIPVLGTVDVTTY